MIHILTSFDHIFTIFWNRHILTRKWHHSWTTFSQKKTWATNEMEMSTKLSHWVTTWCPSSVCMTLTLLILLSGLGGKNVTNPTISIENPMHLKDHWSGWWIGFMLCTIVAFIFLVSIFQWGSSWKIFYTRCPHIQKKWLR